MNMLPSSSFFYVGNRRFRDIILAPKGRFSTPLRKFQFYLCYFRLIQFGCSYLAALWTDTIQSMFIKFPIAPSVVILPTWRKSHLEGMANISTGSSPFKINSAIICLYTVQMIDLMFCWPWSDECQGDHFMYSYQISSFAKGYMDGIITSAKDRAQGIISTFPFYTSEIRGSISRASGNIFPFFFRFVKIWNIILRSHLALSPFQKVNLIRVALALKHLGGLKHYNPAILLTQQNLVGASL